MNLPELSRLVVKPTLTDKWNDIIYTVNDSGLNAMLKCLPKLKHLTIHGLHMTENLENSTFPLLESLELKGKIISNTGLMENNPKIKTLDIDVCAMAEGLIEANFDQLESLKL